MTINIYRVSVNGTATEFPTKNEAFRFAYDSMPNTTLECAVTIKRIQRTC